MSTTHTASAGSSAAKALDRVRKLFAKAESVAGTPEAEVFLERAYGLLAKYGVDEALARSGPDARPAEVTVFDHVVAGRYQPDQVGLVASLAAAMHCRAVTSTRGDGARVVHIVGCVGTSSGWGCSPARSRGSCSRRQRTSGRLPASRRSRTGSRS